MEDHPIGKIRIAAPCTKRIACSVTIGIEGCTKGDVKAGLMLGIETYRVDTVVNGTTTQYIAIVLFQTSNSLKVDELYTHIVAEALRLAGIVVLCKESVVVVFHIVVPYLEIVCTVIILEHTRPDAFVSANLFISAIHKTGITHRMPLGTVGTAIPHTSHLVKVPAGKCNVLKTFIQIVSPLKTVGKHIPVIGVDHRCDCLFRTGNKSMRTILALIRYIRFLQNSERFTFYSIKNKVSLFIQWIVDTEIGSACPRDFKTETVVIW